MYLHFFLLFSRRTRDKSVALFRSSFLALHLYIFVVIFIFIFIFVGRQYVVIEPGPHAPPSCTVICAAATEPAAAEVERSVTAAIKLLYQTVAEPFVCAGSYSVEHR